MESKYFDLLRKVLAINMATNYIEEDFIINYLNEEYEFEEFNQKFEKELMENIISTTNAINQNAIIKHYLIGLEPFLAFYEESPNYYKIPKTEDVYLIFLVERGIRIEGYLNIIKKVCVLFEMDYDTILKKLGLNFDRFHVNFDQLQPRVNKFVSIKKIQVTMLLYELEVFDHLERTFPELRGNETKLAKVLSAVTGVGTDSIRQTYRAIIGSSASDKNNPYGKESNDAFLLSKFKEFGIKMKINKKGEK